MQLCVKHICPATLRETHQSCNFARNTSVLRLCVNTSVLQLCVKHICRATCEKHICPATLRETHQSCNFARNTSVLRLCVNTSVLQLCVKHICPATYVVITCLVNTGADALHYQNLRKLIRTDDEYLASRPSVIAPHGQMYCTPYATLDLN